MAFLSISRIKVPYLGQRHLSSKPLHRIGLLRPSPTRYSCIIFSSKRLLNYYKGPPLRPVAIQDYQEPITSRYTSSEYYEVTKLASNPDMRKYYLDRLSDLENYDGLDLIASHFEKCLYLISQDPECYKQVYEIIHQTFKFAFSPRDEIVPELQDLRDRLLRKRKILINLMMAGKRYEDYASLLAPLLHRPDLSVDKVWADTVMSTIKFQSNRNQLSYDKETIKDYLTGRASDNDKRSLLAIFLRKGLLISTTQRERQALLRSFFKFIQIIEKDLLILHGLEYKPYEDAFIMMAMPLHNVDVDDYITHLKAIVNAAYKDNSKFAELLTNIMGFSSRRRPTLTIKYWEYKLQHGEHLHHQDLTNIMTAYLKLQNHDEVLKLYSRYPLLQHEDQIEVLLKMCESTKNWRMLQKQFEDLYGRGELPYEIHYNIVMNLLASIGATSEVERLFGQFKKRKLPPSEGIYAALIKAHTYHDESKEALEVFNNYIDDMGKDKASAKMYSLIFDIYIANQDFDMSMAHLKKALEIQKTQKIHLVHSSLICKLIDLANRTWNLKGLEELRLIAYSLSHNTEKFYVSLIRAYTYLGEYERADLAAIEAHEYANTPFRTPSILSFQLKNLASWYNHTSDHVLKKDLLNQIWLILETFYHSNNEWRDPQFHAEIIKFHISQGKFGDAFAVLSLALRKEIATETHFIPFLKHYALRNNYLGNTQVMELYKEMAATRTPITANSYIYLLEALLRLDQANENGFVNSYKLLQSVFELNGLSMNQAELKQNISRSDLSKQSVSLCKMVSEYLRANTENSIASAELLANFLNQIKQVLGKSVSPGFRFVLYHNISRLYESQGNNSSALGLVNNGVDELHKIADQFLSNYPFDRTDITIPDSIQANYRNLIQLKLHHAELLNSPITAYYDIYKQADDRGLSLAGYQYNKILTNLLASEDDSMLLVCLDICEKHLVYGNLAEVQMIKEKKFLYHLVMSYLSESMDNETIQRRFGILNKLYNCKRLDDLRKPWLGQDYLRKNRLPKTATLKEIIEERLKYYNSRYATGTRWGLEQLIEEIPTFFHPEGSSVAKKMKRIVSTRLLNRIHIHCEGDQTKAFKLMEQYPVTIEYLIFAQEEKERMSIFRSSINRIIPPAGKNEDSQSKENRTIEALRIMAAK